MGREGGSGEIEVRKAWEGRGRLEGWEIISFVEN